MKNLQLTESKQQYINNQHSIFSENDPERDHIVKIDEYIQV